MKTVKKLNGERQGGVTLVEVVVASLLLIMSLTALLMLFSRTSQSSEAAKRQVHALQVARTDIEQFRSTVYASITGYSTVLLTNGYLAPFEGKKACTVVETNSCKEINVIVSWRSSANNQIISQTMYTIISGTN